MIVNNNTQSGVIAGGAGTPWNIPAPVIYPSITPWQNITFGGSYIDPNKVLLEEILARLKALDEKIGGKQFQLDDETTKYLKQVAARIEKIKNRR